ncbi:MAG TPA: hypothetical protein P5235_08270 [Saprospiraceae bacterium]|nr:hypothetical protein [Saprospiraceae bacterium]MCB9327780.1 hypothetical protein [Lewinellaceae bacterium]HPK09529.1 hypothetical protein [Saprospiraceae bacterium]HRX29368.1 hypothetical protein [Saprospiraceae bacterium]
MDTINSIRLLEEFLNTSQPNQFYLDTLNKCNLTSTLSPSFIYADVCLEISSLYLKLENPEKSLEFIDRIDRDFFPRFGGCLNGILMNKTKISIYLSDYYLNMGQKEMAIKSLLKYFIYGEAYSKKATEILKVLLEEKFEKFKIAQIIENSIENIKLDENNQPVIKLFNEEIILFPVSNIEEAREFCRNNKNLKRIAE